MVSIVASLRVEFRSNSSAVDYGWSGLDGLSCCIENGFGDMKYVVYMLTFFSENKRMINYTMWKLSYFNNTNFRN